MAIERQVGASAPARASARCAGSGGTTGIHVLAHLPAVARALRADYVDPVVSGRLAPGRNGRALSLIGALAGGVVIAILVIPQFAPWISSQQFHR